MNKKVKAYLSVLVLILCVGCIGVVLASTNYNAKYYRVEIEKSDEEASEEDSKVFIKKSNGATINKPNQKAKIALEKWRFLKFGEYGGLAIIGMGCLVLGLGLFGVLKPHLSYFAKKKTARVEVIDIVRKKKTDSAQTYKVWESNRMSQKERVVVRFCDEKRKKKTFYIPVSVVAIGDVGRLTYQWNQGCSFEMEKSLLAESEVGKLKLGLQKYKEEKRK